MADHERWLGDADGVEEGRCPRRVAAEVELVAREVGRAAEPRLRGCVHPAAHPGEPAQRPLVGVLAERPPVEEQDGETLAAPCVPEEGGAPFHLGPFPDEVVRPNICASHRDHSFTVREREETYFNYGE